MASTKTTTRTRKQQTYPARYGLALLYGALALCSLINLFLTMTPVAASNAEIDEAIQNSVAMPAETRQQLFKTLREQQEINLSQRPSEPFGWARLAYLRFVTQHDPKAAFPALQMAELVSPYEAPQLPERAIMWYRLRAVETPEQQAYQDVLWQKAYAMNRDLMWHMAVKNGLVAEVGESLKKTSPSLYDEWKLRAASPPVSP